MAKATDLGPSDVAADDSLALTTRAATHNPPASGAHTRTGTCASAHGAKKMAGGLPMPANQTFLSFREEGHAMPPENEPRLRGERYAVNELQHPQLRVACGFWKTNPRRIRSS